MKTSNKLKAKWTAATAKFKNDKLPKAFKRKWVAALRSGKYKQGQGELHNPNQDSYCCLGVACVVAGVKDTTLIDGVYIEGQYDVEIPDIIRGNDIVNPVVAKLINFNDDKNRSFKWIASYIERYL